MLLGVWPFSKKGSNEFIYLFIYITFFIFLDGKNDVEG